MQRSFYDDKNTIVLQKSARFPFRRKKVLFIFHVFQKFCKKKSLSKKYVLFLLECVNKNLKTNLLVQLSRLLIYELFH